MKIAEIEYLGNLKTHCTHLASGKSIITDAPKDNNGDGSAFSPTDLVATSLGACMLTIMGIKARGLGLDIHNTRISVSKEMGDKPRRIKKIIISIDLRRNNLSPEDTKVLEKAALSCPVGFTLNSDVEQEVEFIV
ncbi:MAG: putative redox protein [Luteibaculaceae bacterium]|jgi:putative redox protein